jgi:hypothetical protein
MTWTYTPTELDEEMNQLRLAIGDTVEEDPQFQDEELQLFLDSTGSVQDAAVMALRALTAKYARYCDKWVGDLKILASQRYRAYQQMLAGMVGVVAAGGVPFAGGIRYSDKMLIENDPDMVQGSFWKGMHDFKGEP